MMHKVQVEVFGLTDRGMSQGAFALLLKESEGQRKMPIIIGVPEAQAIANELEGVRAQRPMTHDLLKNVIDALGAELQEVWIHTLRDGTFYASLVFAVSGLEIDARPSDAIAIAVRCSVPIYVSEDIMEDASLEVAADDISSDDDDEAGSDDDGEDGGDDDAGAHPGQEQRQLAASGSAREESTEPLTYRERLEQELRRAIQREDYETAARLRDELSLGRSSDDVAEDQ
ncbi:MAG: bifunctional nuclease domain-containing protein [Candidatus Kapaibacteriota bacterium]